MQSFMHCWWLFPVTLASLFFLFPTNAVGHLGAALKTGSGALTKIAFGDNVIYCTFTNLGEGKPPILHNHVRVSREPQPHIRRMYKSPDDFEASSDPLKIKSPSYQHKILQFHSNGLTSSSSGHDFVPLKLITSHYPSTKSLPIYPVASKFGKVDSSRLVGSTSTGSLDDGDDNDEAGGDSWERYSSKWQPNLLPKPEQPTFTPFIGARALTHIPLFFKHLRENIHSVYERQRQAHNNNEVIETQPAKVEENDVDKSGESEDIKIATPTRRGYSSNSADLLIDDDDDGSNNKRDYRTSEIYTLGRRMGAENGGEMDPETKELLHFLGHVRPEYPKANNYNPAWLFTNLGLGKRKRSSGASNSVGVGGGWKSNSFYRTK